MAFKVSKKTFFVEIEECGKNIYKTAIQLLRHKKKHGKFSCDKCECEFNFEGVLEKHMDVVHKSIKIFCHYYNNNKEYPYKDQCIYAHEVAKERRFGNDCERIMCMFRHEEHHPEE